MPKRKKTAAERAAYFLRNEQPSVSLALPPVGWQRTVVQPWQMTTVWAWEKTVVMVKQPGHLTSMKKDRGAGTRVYRMSAPSTGRQYGIADASEGSYLELVLAGLSGRAGVEEINGENLEKSTVSISPCIDACHPAILPHRCLHLPLHADCPVSGRDLSRRQSSDVRLQI